MLKNKFIWTCLILMATLLQSSAIITYAELPDGYFDQMEGNVIVGWGWESSHPNTIVPVHIRITNEETSQIIGDYYPAASLYREDLRENNVGNGRHGFRLSMDWSTLPDGLYRIEGWIDEKKFGNTQSYAKGEAAQKTLEASLSAQNPAPETETAVTAVRSLGTFRTTGYCPCTRCCGKWGKQTSTGAVPRSGHTIAVDPRVIPYGTKLMINGIIYTAEDCGGGVKGKHIDIYYDTHMQALRHGSRSAEVFLVP